jgi:tyrosyl-tRNA synthetase
MIHSAEDYEAALKASEILFGKGSAEDLENLGSKMLAGISQTLPTSIVSAESLNAGIPIIDFVSDNGIASSKREAREFVKNNAISINKAKVKDGFIVNADSLLHEKYILVQRGKKKYHLVICK